MNREKYDPNKPVCNNQKDFNIALRHAINAENSRGDKASLFLYVVILFIMIVWAISIAMKMPPSSDRIMHLVFAMLFSPIYIISYYLSRLK